MHQISMPGRDLYAVDTAFSRTSGGVGIRGHEFGDFVGGDERTEVADFIK